MVTKNARTYGRLVQLGFLALAPYLALVAASPLQAKCAKKYEPPQGPTKKEEVHKDTPFAPGEVATYAVYYMGIKVGYGSLKVLAPTFYEGSWHRVFFSQASTGDWYRAIFVAKDESKAYSQASDFGVKWFRLSQDENKIFGDHFRQDKVLEFNQRDCWVRESTKLGDKAVVKEEIELEGGATDALSAVYKLRTLNFKLGKTERMLVYTSQKNWWLEAEPLLHEKLTVGAGVFDTVKIKLRTYLGKELQQKGDVFVWLATSHPQRPVVKIGGEIKIGSVEMPLESFRAGAL